MTTAETEFVDIDPMADPASYNAAAAKVLGAGTKTAIPTIPDQPDAFFNLPGGVLVEDRPVYEVEVRELTGADEEKIDRARSSQDPGRFLNTVVECGTVRLGTHEATTALLDSVLVGDRDHLLLAIREATYGPEIEIGTVTCVGCGHDLEVTLEVTDIPVRRLESPRDQRFEIALRKGRSARVHLPTVADSKAYTDDPNLTTAERNSILLSRCVDEVEEANGDVTSVAAFPSIVRERLGVADRNKILKEIANRMPGPRYDEVTITHDECGAKTPTPIGLVPLFPGL